MARFILPFGREARWTADASHAFAVLGDGRDHLIRLLIRGASDDQRTRVDLTLRFQDLASAPPAATVRLFAGGALGPEYTARVPREVVIPASARRVELHATITGHGAEEAYCAEYCDQHHTFTIGGRRYVWSDPTAGDQRGCLEGISSGTVANQAGTWWARRTGWCPGRAVSPWIVDVTDAVVPGETAVVTYAASLAGEALPTGGDVVMASRLVFFE